MSRKWTALMDRKSPEPTPPTPFPTASCVGCLFAPFGDVANIALRGYVLWVLYGWFVVPLWPATPSLSWAHITALYVIFCVCRSKTPATQVKFDSGWYYSYSIGTSLTFLGVGWLLKHAVTAGW